MAETITTVLYSQADIALLLSSAGAGDYDTVYNRVRTWRKRGKLGQPAAHRPNGYPLWSKDVADDLLAQYKKDGA